jgi:hypothetical protein
LGRGAPREADLLRKRIGKCATTVKEKETRGPAALAKRKAAASKAAAAAK